MATMNQKVYLAEADEQHLEALKGFSLEENQLQYTSMPIPAYEKCLIDRNRLPVVIMGNGRVVGFFVLDQGGDVTSYSANPHAMLLRAFLVNRTEQGMGYGRASIDQLQPFVRDRFPKCNEIVLGVNEDNEAARQLYLKAGFVDSNEKKLGRSGYQAILRYKI